MTEDEVFAMLRLLAAAATPETGELVVFELDTVQGYRAWFKERSEHEIWDFVARPTGEYVQRRWTTHENWGGFRDERLKPWSVEDGCVCKVVNLDDEGG